MLQSRTGSLVRATASSRLIYGLTKACAAPLPSQLQNVYSRHGRLQSSTSSGAARQSVSQPPKSAAASAPFASKDFSEEEEVLLDEEAPSLLDANARIKRRMGPADSRLNGLTADPYGWAPEDRSMREAPMWMVLEAEREEVRLPKEAKRKRADSDSLGAELEVPQIDAHGRAYGTGRRKTSVARVWVSLGDGQWSVNGKGFTEYFPRMLHRTQALEPFLATQACGAFNVTCFVHGGGHSGQAGALKHGVAKALAAFDPLLKPILKQLGHLHRDPRMVERKKPGQKKARKKFQWVKR